jgi:hypothetical protein
MNMGRLKLIMGLLILLFLQSAIANPPLFPTHRIVAYYGNFLSKKMGVLGEYPPEQMLKMLNQEVKKWEAADPKKPVIPAIEYIAVVAQKDAGADGKYRARMPDEHIRKAIALADKINGIAILDVQIGFSSVLSEIARLEPYLKLPNVMLALDPEFSMKTHLPPGKVIGTMDAKEINLAVNYLAEIVRKHNLPPKFLVVHSFTENMVTSDKHIKPVPEVQVVLDMDGWGSKSLKTGSYREFVAAESVQFPGLITGIKLFYKNDIKKPSTGLMSPGDILKLKPVPLFILYQ